MTDHFKDVKYWNDELQKNEQEFEPTLSHLYRIPIEPLTIEELLRLRTDLMEVTSNIRLLGYAVTKLEADLNKPLWRKLLEK